MQLDRLPVEIQQYIFLLLDLTSINCLSFTCKTLQRSLWSSKGAILDNLRRLPGFPETDPSIPLKRLASDLQKSLSNNTRHGVEILGTRALYTSSIPRRIALKTTLLQQCRCGKNHAKLAVTSKADHLVKLYNIKGTTIEYIATLDVQPALDDRDETPLQVVKIAIFEGELSRECRRSITGDVFVLYRYVVSFGEDNAFTKAAKDHLARQVLLVRYRNGTIIKIWTFVLAPNMEVVDMAADSNNYVALVIRASKERQLLVKLNTLEKVHSISTTVYQMEFPDTSDALVGPSLVHSIRIVGDYLVLHTSFPLPFGDIPWPTPNRNFDDDSEPIINVSRCSIYCLDEMRTYMAPFWLTEPFAVAHRCHYTDVNTPLDDDGEDDDNDKPCLNTYLGIGIKCGLDVAGNTCIVKHDTESTSDAYVMKGVHYVEICNHMTLGSRTISAGLEYPVAKLLGFAAANREQQTSYGPLLAISQGGSRIAIAIWKRVLVWTINPGAFLNPEEDPTVDLGELDKAGDPAYLTKCGWPYYAMNAKCGNAVEIEPTEFKGVEVIHRVAFAGEDCLWAVTDRGVLALDLRSIGTEGRTLVKSLPETGNGTAEVTDSEMDEMSEWDKMSVEDETSNEDEAPNQNQMSTQDGPSNQDEVSDQEEMSDQDEMSDRDEETEIMD